MSLNLHPILLQLLAPPTSRAPKVSGRRKDSEIQDEIY